MHETEYEVSYLFEFQRDKSKKVASLYFSKIGLGIIVIYDSNTLLYNIPNTWGDILERRIIDDDRHALNKVLIVTSGFLKISLIWNFLHRKAAQI